jgi:colicin import membrane protein
MTGTQEIAIQLGGLRRRELRRLFAISFTAHLVLVAAFGFSPQSRISVPRGVVTVELVRAPAAARPAVPVPVAKPAPPKSKKVVLPAEPSTPKVKPKVVKPAVVAKPPPVKPTPAPAEEYEDVLAQLRAESGEDAPPVEIAKAAPTAIGSPGSPDGVAISPEVAAWIKRVKIQVRRNWVLEAGFRTQDIEALVEFELDASGGVRGTPRLSRRSGNPWYDEGVIRAIQKSSPLPAPPEAGKWSILFSSWDSY